MKTQLLSMITIAIAFVIAVLAIALPPANINFVIVISRFFEVMIPFLAVGALIKFLLRW